MAVSEKAASAALGVAARDDAADDAAGDEARHAAGAEADEAAAATAEWSVATLFFVCFAGAKRHAGIVAAGRRPRDGTSATTNSDGENLMIPPSLILEVPLATALPLPRSASSRLFAGDDDGGGPATTECAV